MASIRKPIVTVLGHVDHGKTKLLDRIRGTAIAEKEAGAITQHIGATEVPIEVVKKISSGLAEKYGFELKIPGLLFIDTPGHEAFANLRKRGGSIADLAVLVVDVMQGLQAQTYESIEILKAFKTPFIVALNKIDSLNYYNSENNSFTENIKKQNADGEKILDEKIYEVVGKLHEKGFQSERFDRVRDFTQEVSIVPCSAKTGEGVAEILLFLSALSQKYLEKELKMEVEGAGKGTVLEIKEEKGLGKTIDVILYDGTIKVGEEIVVASSNGIVKTKIRALFEPKALEEIRDPKEKFKSVKEVHAAAGVKIAAPNLESVLAGSPLLAVEKGDEEEVVRKEIDSLKVESEAVGPIVKTDALGSLEAIVKMLEDKGVKVRRADVGEVSKRDVLEALSVKEKNNLKGVVLAFNTKVKDIALMEAEKGKVKIFQGNVVYKILEDYEKWVLEEKEAEKRKVLEGIVFPARFKILHGFIFRNSKPAIVGVKVVAGRIKVDVKVFSEKGIVGTIKAIQSKGENLKEAKKGEEVAVSIEGATVGRNIEEEQELNTFVPKKDIEAIQEHISLFSEEEKVLLEEIKEKEKKIKR